MIAALGLHHPRPCNLDMDIIRLMAMANEIRIPT